MRSLALHLSETEFDGADFGALQDFQPDLVLAFFSHAAIRHAAVIARLQQACTGTQLVGCSTGGEIGSRGLSQRGLAVMAMRLERGRMRSASWALARAADSKAAGLALAAQLAAPDLHSLIVFAQGLDVDASALIEALGEGAGPQVTISGGLASEGGFLVGGVAVGLGAHVAVPVAPLPDGEDAVSSWTLHNHSLDDRRAVAIGVYGEGIRVTTGMSGGAQAFGPVRKVTRVDGHLLHELDGEPALEIYRRYLGPYAADLPDSGLLFPFALLDEQLVDTGLIRTLVGIDVETRSLVMGGDLVPGSHVRLMRASAEALVGGARAAARAAQPLLPIEGDAVAILVSCVDRKLVMGSRIEDEIEAVGDLLGHQVKLTGFYANGEIGPVQGSQACRLNNQTMAITCLSE